MKRKNRIPIICIVSILAVVFSAFCYHEYETRLQYNTLGPNKENRTIQIIGAHGGDTFISAFFQDELLMFRNKNSEIVTEIYDLWKKSNCETPIIIKSKIEIKGLKTVYTYYGTITNNDNTITDYHKSFSINYIPTFKIPEEFKG